MNTAIVLHSEILGRGDDDLGKKLMGSFLRKLWSTDNKPEVIIFYNSAVKLLLKESGVMDALEHLSEVGVELIACGTCIGYYDIEDKIQLGRVSNMDEIVSILTKAEKVITP